jgi:hypothetical protein
VILADGAGNLAGPIALLVVLLMGLASWLLFRSMTARIKRLPDSFEPRTPEDEDDADR